MLIVTCKWVVWLQASRGIWLICETSIIQFQISAVYMFGFWFKTLPAAIPCWTYQFSSDHWSQATLGPDSTWMGDRLGTPGAAGFFFFLLIKNRVRPHQLSGTDVASIWVKRSCLNSWFQSNPRPYCTGCWNKLFSSIKIHHTDSQAVVSKNSVRLG